MKKSPWIGSTWGRLSPDGDVFFWITLLDTVDSKHWSALVQAVGLDEFRIREKYLFPEIGIKYLRID